MIRYTLASVVAAAAFALIGAAPSMAAQPYPLNYKTFALGSPEARPLGEKVRELIGGAT